MSKYKGNHRTIYIGTLEWSSIGVRAKLEGRTISSYLRNLHRVSLDADNSARPENLESHTQKAVGGLDDSAKPAQPEKFESHKPSGREGLSAAETKPDPVQKAAKDLEKLIGKEKKVAWVNPLGNSVLGPKSQQTGKKK